jgi:ABC-2 type transport system permease protein
VIAVELGKLLRRPRTWIVIGLLDALPTLVAILLRVTHVGPRPGQGPALLSAVLSNGRLFPAAALAIVLPLFLPVSVAVVAGDAVAGEAQAGTLRYLLARPVGRTRLLVAKLVTTLVFVFIAVVVVTVTAYFVGTRLFGSQPLSEAVSSVSGTPLTVREMTLRTLLTMLYVALSMLGVAAVALFLSTVTDSPLAAALGALAILVTSTLLLTLDAARALQPYLPTRYWLSFVDLFRQPILWRDIVRGVSLQAVYVVVLLGAAWANFTTKDIKS